MSAAAGPLWGRSDFRFSDGIPFGFFSGAVMLAYLLPWLINPGAGLTFNAYDLAEWTSLHPAVRANPPPLLLTFALRLPLVYLALLTALHRPKSMSGRIGQFSFLLGAVVALLPPLEFFTQASSDPNYQQQLVLALIASVGSAAALMGALRPVNDLFVTVFSLLTGAACAGGLFETLNLMRDFALPVQLGPGGLLFALLCIFAGIIRLNQMR